MKKIITIVIILILVALGGWYLFSQQEVEDEPESIPEIENEEATNNEEESSNAEQEEVEIDADNPYAQSEEIPPIPGVYETTHELLEEVFNQVFSEVKLIDASVDSDPGDPKFDYSSRSTYMVPVEINTDQAGEIREAMLDQGWNITSTETDADSYVYWYEFEIDNEIYDGRMDVIFGKAEPGNDGQEIKLDIRQNSD